MPVAVLILLQVAAAQAEPPPPAVQAYFVCAANRSEGVAREPPRRAASDIVSAAIASCVSLRPPALAEGLALMLSDPGVRDWIRRENVPEAEARRVGEAEFDRALRRQLLRNIGANPDAEEVRDAQN